MEVIPQSIEVFKTAFTEAPEVAAQRRHTDAAHNAGFSGRSNLDKALIGAGVAAAVAIPAAMVAAKILQRDGEAAQ